MIDGRPRRRQRSVLYLEPKRSVATIAYSFLTLLAAAVLAGAYVSYKQAVPQQTQSPNVSQQAANITAAVAICLGLIWLTLAIVNGRRWHLGRVVERLSKDPALAGYLPDTQMPQTPRARLIPVLDIDDRSPRRIPKPPQLWRVTASHNVVGEQPLSIVYLRMFENQPRTRTFIQGAWREFGYVYFLRSAKSVTPSEFRRARGSQDIAGLFISSEEQFAAQLARPPAGPSGGYWHSFKNIGPQMIRVRDWHGSFPPQGFLCHGAIWKTAVELLLDRADLVVLDMSGFMPGNLGVRYELQRVIDRVPIERVILLADRRSDRNFLRDQIRHAWEQMEEGSPNSGPQPRVARLAVTDTYRKIRQVQGQPGPPGQPGQTGQTTHIRVKLTARRSQSRRLAADAPAARQRLRPSREPPAAPPIKPAPEAAVRGSGEPTLVVMSGPGQGRRLTVPPGGLTLGRDELLGPPFSTDNSVSRRHAAVDRRGDGSVDVTDLGSANGTYLNGRQVTAATPMNDSDVLRLGRVELRLEIPRPAAATSGNDTAATQPGPRADDQAGPPSVLFLRQRRPPSSSAWELTGDRLTIGREASSDIVVSDPVVSRHHADLVYDGQSWSIIDAGSANGTFVNGAGVHQTALRPGDRIEIGDTELIVTRGR
jgi:pSer/pThr/pTyr-binding forkhead associated (FHA) protein